MATSPFRSVSVVAGLAIWLAVATGASALGLVALFPLPFPQVLLVTLVAGVMTLYLASARFRTWANSVDARWLVAVHLARFVGFYFLFLYSVGEMPYAFAVPAGIGDILVAALALCLIAAWRALGAKRDTALLAWNAIGLADITFVVATATRLGLTEPESMLWITRLPLALLPTFLVPIVVATHLIVFSRLFGRRSSVHADGAIRTRRAAR